MVKISTRVYHVHNILQPGGLLLFSPFCGSCARNHAQDLRLAQISLLILLLLILIGSLCEILVYYWSLTKHKVSTIPDALYFATDNLIHWIIAVTHIRASFETRMLLNKNTYEWISKVDVSVRKFRCWLTLANIFVTILILVITACEYFGDTYRNLRLLTVSDYSSVTFQFLCMIAWTWTLIRLYNDIKHVEKLLPNKRLFKIHGILLAVYMALSVLNQVILIIANQLIKDYNTGLILLGSNFLLLNLTNLVEINMPIMDGFETWLLDLRKDIEILVKQKHHPNLRRYRQHLKELLRL